METNEATATEATETAETTTEPSRFEVPDSPLDKMVQERFGDLPDDPFEQELIAERAAKGEGEEDQTDETTETEAEEAAELDSIETPDVPSPAANFNEDLRDRALTAGLDQRVIEAFEQSGMSESEFRGYVKEREHAAPDTTVEEEEAEDLKFELDPEETAPEVIDAFNQMSDKFKEQSRQLSIVTKALEQRTKQDESRQFDALVTANGDTYQRLLGKGEPDASQRSNRGRVRDAMDVLRTAFEANGQRVNDADLLHKAVAFEFSDQLKSLARESVTKDLAERSKKVTSRPTQARQAPNGSPRQRALTRMAGILEQKGYDELAESRSQIEELASAKKDLRS